MQNTSTATLEPHTENTILNTLRKRCGHVGGDLEEGDIESSEWLPSILVTKEDHDEHEGWVAAAIRALKNEYIGACEADSSHGTPIWFSEVDGDTCFTTGNTTRKSVFPNGFTDAEMLELKEALCS